MKRNRFFIVCIILPAFLIFSACSSGNQDNAPGLNSTSRLNTNARWFTDDELAGYGADGMYLPDDAEVTGYEDGQVSMKGLNQEAYDTYVTDTYSYLKRNNVNVYALSKENEKAFEKMGDSTVFDHSRNRLFYRYNDLLFMAEINYDSASLEPMATLNFRNVTDLYRGYTFP